jgi:NAD(P)H-flavin reductase
MKNPLLPLRAKIIAKTKQNDTLNCFRLQLDRPHQRDFQFVPGQFMMVGLPGYGDAAFTTSSDPRDNRKYFDICVRVAGELTAKINDLNVGDYLYVRGAFGNGFPEVKQNLIIIGGGCGFAPLKAVLLENIKRDDIKIQAFIGCKNKNTLLFSDHYADWQKRIHLNVILEEEPYPGFSEEKGFVTDAIRHADLLLDPIVYVCGPEVMYRFVVKELEIKGIKPENIYLSYERRMYCGMGVCQHCAIGSCYVCQDGPVFSVKYLRDNFKKHDVDL